MAEYKKSKSVWIIYALVAVVVYAIIALVYLQPQQPARQAEITVSSQGIANGNVLIDSVFLDKPGFVVIHKAVGGTLGPVIGNSGLLSGERTGVSVPIDASQAGTRVFAMLHYDNGDGVYTTVDEDAPVVLAEGVVVKSVDIIAQASPSPAESPAASSAPSCWTCAPEKYSEWISDATCDSGCGETFGPGGCHSDACTEPTPTPSTAPSPTPTPTPTPIPVIGGGGY